MSSPTATPCSSSDPSLSSPEEATQSSIRSDGIPRITKAEAKHPRFSKRRKLNEIRSAERRRGHNEGCRRECKRTSTSSIVRHKEVCRRRLAPTMQAVSHIASCPTQTRAVLATILRYEQRPFGRIHVPTTLRQWQGFADISTALLGFPYAYGFSPLTSNSFDKDTVDDATSAALPQLTQVTTSITSVSSYWARDAPFTHQQAVRQYPSTAIPIFPYSDQLERPRLYSPFVSLPAQRLSNEAHVDDHLTGPSTRYPMPSFPSPLAPPALLLHSRSSDSTATTLPECTTPSSAPVTDSLQKPADSVASYAIPPALLRLIHPERHPLQLSV